MTATAISIHPDGSYDKHLQPIDFEKLGKMVAAEGEDFALAGRVQLSIPGVTLWDNDNFMALSDQGLLRRNQIGTAVAVDLGAARQPYAGTLVLTGLRYDPMEGFLPVPLDAESETILTELIKMMRSVAGLDNYDWKADFPAEFTEGAERAAQAKLRIYEEPFRGLQISHFSSIDDVIRAFEQGGL